MSVFVDTGVLMAAAYRRDEHHSKAAAILKGLREEVAFTTNHVVVETWALLRSRSGYAIAMQFWRGLRDTPLIIEAVTLPDLQRAETIADRWKEREFDLVDCTSFAMMERLRCARAATFDSDFSIYRHGPERNRAFEILG